VRARLERLLADPRAAVRGVAVLACAPGELHDIGLLTIAVALRADGWRVTYLGAATPYADALELAGRTNARVVCFSATTDERADELERSAGEARRPDGADVIVGGAAMGPERARRVGGRYLAGNVPDVVQRLRRLAA
jgi:MerR family transcriptional regulator, light-induced transcriptional regulator